MSDVEDDGDGSSAEGLLLAERETEEGLLVAVCDAAILGETLAEGDLSLSVTEEFYGGEAADADRVAESLARCDTANLVGSTAVGVAIDHGFVEADNVLEIDGTPHAQLLWM